VPHAFRSTARRDFLKAVVGGTVGLGVARKALAQAGASQIMELLRKLMNIVPVTNHQSPITHESPIANL